MDSSSDEGFVSPGPSRGRGKQKGRIDHQSSSEPPTKLSKSRWTKQRDGYSEEKKKKDREKNRLRMAEKRKARSAEEKNASNARDKERMAEKRKGRSEKQHVADNERAKQGMSAHRAGRSADYDK